MISSPIFTIYVTPNHPFQWDFPVEGQKGPKRGFPTLRCDLPGAGGALGRGWRCDAATLPGAGDAVTLRRGSDAAMLLALRRFLLQECTRRGFAARHARCI